MCQTYVFPSVYAMSTRRVQTKFYNFLYWVPRQIFFFLDLIGCLGIIISYSTRILTGIQNTSCFPFGCGVIVKVFLGIAKILQKILREGLHWHLEGARQENNRYSSAVLFRLSKLEETILEIWLSPEKALIWYADTSIHRTNAVYEPCYQHNHDSGFTYRPERPCRI